MSSPEEEVQHQRPPVFKKWKTWYGLVVAVLVVQIIVYYLITIHFS